MYSSLFLPAAAMAHRRFGLARLAASSCPTEQNRSLPKGCHFGEIASSHADAFSEYTVYDAIFLV
jgi:hypothetical protein